MPRPIRFPVLGVDPVRELPPLPAWVARFHIPPHPSMQIGSAGQPLPVWAPLHAIEDGVGVVEVPQDLDTGPGTWVPHPDGPTPPATGEPAASGPPPHALRDPASATRPPG